MPLPSMPPGAWVTPSRAETQDWAKMPVRMEPTMPPMPWSLKTSRPSSIRSHWFMLVQRAQTTEAMKPIRQAIQGETNPAAGVTPVVGIRNMQCGVFGVCGSMYVRTDEACNGAAASSDNGEFAFVSDEVNEDPAEDTCGSGGVCVECGHHSSYGAVDSGTALQLSVLDGVDVERAVGVTYIEAEPTEPNQNSAEENQSGVVWPAMRLLTSLLSLAQGEGICERRPSRRNVNRSSTSKVQTGEFEQPSVGIPCPASDGTIHLFFN